MRWRRLSRRIKKYLWERVTLTLVPHAKSNSRGVHLPRLAMFLVLLCFFGYLFSVTYLYRNYMNRFLHAQATIVSLQEVKTENITLKAGLAQVAAETEKMRQVITELEKKGEHIESLLTPSRSGSTTTSTSSTSSGTAVKQQDSSNDAIFYSYKLLEGSGIPLGGGEEYFEANGFELLSQIREELIMLRAEVPIHEDALETLESTAEKHAALKAATPTGWPLSDGGQGYITSEFGFRKDPVTGQQVFHEGIDVGVWYGTPILATASGRVVFSGWKSGYGRVIIVDHGYGYQTRYAHNSKLVVDKGDKINRGTVIAYSGNSGKSTGPHLHYEVRVNGIPKNPRNFNFKR